MVSRTRLSVRLYVRSLSCSYVFICSTAVYIFSLFRMLEFLWRFIIAQPASGPSIVAGNVRHSLKILTCSGGNSALIVTWSVRRSVIIVTCSVRRSVIILTCRVSVFGNNVMWSVRRSVRIVTCSTRRLIMFLIRSARRSLVGVECRALGINSELLTFRL
jgi:hypothetical protein